MVGVPWHADFSHLTGERSVPSPPGAGNGHETVVFGEPQQDGSANSYQRQMQLFDNGLTYRWVSRRRNLGTCDHDDICGDHKDTAAQTFEQRYAAKTLAT